MIFDRFPIEHANWDRFSAFHVGVGMKEFFRPTTYNDPALLLFDTGELVGTHMFRRPWARGDYPLVGVSLLTTSDIPLYNPQGERVPKSHLNHGGQQNIMVDWASGRAVSLDYTMDKSALPTRFDNYAVRGYIGGPDRMPWGASLRQAVPYRKASFTDDERARIDEFEKVTKCAMVLTEHAETKHGYYWSQPLDPNTALSCDDWRKLNRNQLHGLFHRGIGRQVVKHNYLLTSPDGKPYDA